MIRMRTDREGRLLDLEVVPAQKEAPAAPAPRFRLEPAVRRRRPRPCQMAACRTRVDAARQLGCAGRLDRRRPCHRIRPPHRGRCLAREAGFLSRHR